jgi:hypothetical protein
VGGGHVFDERCECQLVDVDEDGKFANPLFVPNSNRLEVCVRFRGGMIHVDVKSLSLPPAFLGSPSGCLPKEIMEYTGGLRHFFLANIGLPFSCFLIFSQIRSVVPSPHGLEARIS